jgi:hypothetical protein
MVGKIFDIIDIAEKNCKTLISAFPGSSAGCTVPLTFFQGILKKIKFVLAIAAALSVGIFETVVDTQNSKFERERQQVTLENVNTIHDNLISNFNLGQQLKLLLGGVLEALPSGDSENDETRRRLSVDCEDADEYRICKNSTKVSCEDPKYLCNGFSINWNYVAFLKFGEK